MTMVLLSWGYGTYSNEIQKYRLVKVKKEDCTCTSERPKYIIEVMELDACEHPSWRRIHTLDEFSSAFHYLAYELDTGRLKINTEPEEERTRFYLSELQRDVSICNECMCICVLCERCYMKGAL